MGNSELIAAAARALGPILLRGLGFDPGAAVRAGQLRLVVLHTVDASPLPKDWAIPIDEGEVVVASAPLEPPLAGVAALVVDPAVLPRAKLDDASLDRVAAVLVDALIAEMRGPKRARRG